jgi:hypothetical protein
LAPTGRGFPLGGHRAVLFLAGERELKPNVQGHGRAWLQPQPDAKRCARRRLFCAVRGGVLQAAFLIPPALPALSGRRDAGVHSRERHPRTALSRTAHTVISVCGLLEPEAVETSASPTSLPHQNGGAGVLAPGRSPTSWSTSRVLKHLERLIYRCDPARSAGDPSAENAGPAGSDQPALSAELPLPDGRFCVESLRAGEGSGRSRRQRTNGAEHQRGRWPMRRSGGRSSVRCLGHIGFLSPPPRSQLPNTAQPKPFSRTPRAAARSHSAVPRLCAPSTAGRRGPPGSGMRSPAKRQLAPLALCGSS